MQQQPAAHWITTLDLRPHPEGGHYRESYRAAGQITGESLPETMAGSRCYATAIYYLLEAGEVSRFHRIQSDELWFFHSGGPLEIIVVSPSGDLSRQVLGPELELGQSFHVVVPAGCWFGARPQPSFAGHALVSCVVAPGFSFQDFELAGAEDMEKWPALRQVPELCPPFH